MRQALPALNPFCLALALAVSLPLAGCGEFAYKRGGSSRDYELAQQQCTARSPDSGSGYAQCMQDKGWTVTQPDDWNPVAAVMPHNDNRNPTSSLVPIAAMEEKAGPGKAPEKIDRSVPPDPMTKYNVGSWWKGGAGAGALQADMRACGDKLGPPHQMQSGSNIVTRAFVLCMRDKDWTGVGSKVE